MQTQVRILFYVAGFDRDLQGVLNEARRILERDLSRSDLRFESRRCRSGFEFQERYWKSVADELVSLAFGPNAEVGFCGPDGLCNMGRHRWSRALCKKNNERTLGCRLMRPAMLVMIAPADRFDAIYGRFGNCCLLVTTDESAFTDGEAIASYLKPKIPVMASIRDFMHRLPRNHDVPHLPVENFERASGRTVSRRLLENPEIFESESLRLHRELYDPAFQNPEKPRLRGGYRFGKEIFFQKDRLHNTAHLGQSNRDHAYHLLRAFYRFGTATAPGMHFDVMREDGAGLGQIFADFLTGRNSVGTETYLNISPCDRLLST